MIVITNRSFNMRAKNIVIMGMSRKGVNYCHLTPQT